VIEVVRLESRVFARVVRVEADRFVLDLLRGLVSPVDPPKQPVPGVAFALSLHSVPSGGFELEQRTQLFDLALRGQTAVVLFASREAASLEQLQVSKNVVHYLAQGFRL